MTTTLRSPIDGTTQEVDHGDKGRLDRLVEMGYQVVDKASLATLPGAETQPAAKKASTRKRSSKK